MSLIRKAIIWILIDFPTIIELTYNNIIFIRWMKMCRLFKRKDKKIMVEKAEIQVEKAEFINSLEGMNLTVRNVITLLTGTKSNPILASENIESSENLLRLQYPGDSIRIRFRKYSKSGPKDYRCNIKNGKVKIFFDMDILDAKIISIEEVQNLGNYTNINLKPKIVSLHSLAIEFIFVID